MLDTETTGLEVNQGHRIIEIGCVELVNRRITGRRLCSPFNLSVTIDTGALEVHGITQEFLAGKPKLWGIAGAFIDFVRGAELVMVAPFDCLY